MVSRMSSPLDKKLRDLRTLLELAEAMSGVRDTQRLLELIVASASRLVDADRSSLFLRDDDGSLWTKVAEGSSDIIRLPPGWGIAGLVARTGKVVNIRDAYDDPRFDRQIDRKTGFRTRSILCVPLVDKEGAVVGVLEAMNKKGGEPFDGDDEERLRALCSHAAVAVESQRLLDGERLRQRMESEMEVARRIQSGLLPRRMPTLAGLRLAAWMETADKTGGDYYDVIEAPQGSLDLIVCDVSGHGIAAALLMATTRAYGRAVHTVESDPRKVMDRLNRLLVPDMPSDSFVTMTLARIGADGSACYVSAGHPPPLVYRAAQGVFDSLEETDLLLGFDGNASFTAHQVDPLRRGDVVVLFTDGLYEAASPEGGSWGLAAVKEVIAASARDGAEGIVAALREGVASHLEGRPRQDDVTLLVAERL